MAKKSSVTVEINIEDHILNEIIKVRKTLTREMKSNWVPWSFGKGASGVDLYVKLAKYLEEYVLSKLRVLRGLEAREHSKAKFIEFKEIRDIEYYITEAMDILEHQLYRAGFPEPSGAKRDRLIKLTKIELIKAERILKKLVKMELRFG